LHREAAKWIAKLNLRKHPEGGYFRETFRAEPMVGIPGREGTRNISTAIYYLLARNQISSFHRMKSDEIWHWYAGGTLSLYVIENQRLTRHKLGTKRNAAPQRSIRRGCWMAASLSSGHYCLVGCTVSPGFDFRDWELGERAELVALFTSYKAVINKHTTV
jgi:predicted cupin superfamily sugar epimerase